MHIFLLIDLYIFFFFTRICSLITVKKLFERNAFAVFFYISHKSVRSIHNNYYYYYRNSVIIIIIMVKRIYLEMRRRNVQKNTFSGRISISPCPRVITCSVEVSTRYGKLNIENCIIKVAYSASVCGRYCAAMYRIIVIAFIIWNWKKIKLYFYEKYCEYNNSVTSVVTLYATQNCCMLFEEYNFRIVYRTYLGNGNKSISLWIVRHRVSIYIGSNIFRTIFNCDCLRASAKSNRELPESSGNVTKCQKRALKIFTVQTRQHKFITMVTWSIIRNFS